MALRRVCKRCGFWFVGYTVIADYDNSAPKPPLSLSIAKTMRRVRSSQGCQGRNAGLAARVDVGDWSDDCSKTRWLRPGVPVLAPPPADQAGQGGIADVQLRSTAKWSWSMTPMSMLHGRWPAISRRPKTPDLRRESPRIPWCSSTNGESQATFADEGRNRLTGWPTRTARASLPSAAPKGQNRHELQAAPVPERADIIPATRLR